MEELVHLRGNELFILVEVRKSGSAIFYLYFLPGIMCQHLNFSNQMMWGPIPCSLFLQDENFLETLSGRKTIKRHASRRCQITNSYIFLFQRMNPNWPPSWSSRDWVRILPGRKFEAIFEDNWNESWNITVVQTFIKYCYVILPEAQNINRQ